jgi:hypothetical protein
VPDIANRTVTTCVAGAVHGYRGKRGESARRLTRFFKEQFFTPVAAATGGVKFTGGACRGSLVAWDHAAGGAGKQQGAGSGCLSRGRVRLL